MELKRGSLIRGTMEACNLHLHNLKTIQLLDIEGKYYFWPDQSRQPGFTPIHPSSITWQTNSKQQWNHPKYWKTQFATSCLAENVKDPKMFFLCLGCTGLL